MQRGEEGMKRKRHRETEEDRIREGKEKKDTSMTDCQKGKGLTLLSFEEVQGEEDAELNGKPVN